MTARRLTRLGVYAGLVVLLLWTLLPLYWLFTLSFENLAETITVPVHWVVTHATWHNYAVMFTQMQRGQIGWRFLHALRNSTEASVLTTLFCLFFGSNAAYVLARYRVAGKNLISMAFLASNLLPQIALVIPFYVLVVGVFGPLHLYGTNLLLIILYTSFILGFVVWIMRGYFDMIPADLEEAARVDGASRFTAFWRVIMPLAAPGLVATALIAFLLSWDQFLLPLIFAPNPQAYNLPFFIYSLNGQYLHQYNEIAAGGILTSIPPVLIVLFFGKYIVSGMTQGAVKG